jgi:hypothetical protein
VSTNDNLRRLTQWNGVSAGDAVIVDDERERRSSFTFVAHVTNLASGDAWVEVHGGKANAQRTRSFRPEQIFPATAKKGSRIVGPSLADAPRLDLG